jgi:hypothetical protein
LVDLASQRVLITLKPNPGERPRVVRIDAPNGDDLLREASTLEAALSAACVEKLRRRWISPRA